MKELEKAQEELELLEAKETNMEARFETLHKKKRPLLIEFQKINNDLEWLYYESKLLELGLKQKRREVNRISQRIHNEELKAWKKLRKELEEPK